MSREDEYPDREYIILTAALVGGGTWWMGNSSNTRTDGVGAATSHLIKLDSTIEEAGEAATWH
ncbi:MAG: hypothetical protein ACYTGM_19645 [Planctomycetota bacterium]|jgi:hypothetical protein